MTPTNEPRPPHDTERTAMSGTDLDARSVADERTDSSAPADTTVVRSTPSAQTVNEKKPEAASFGKYELVGEIARGGMGVVYRARQPGLDRTVALKMILGTGTDHEAAVRFLQEARAAAALDHPNVVPIYDIGEIDGRPYFTMALVDGPNLRGYTDARGTLPIAEVVHLFAQVVEGVAHAHKHGIIHRDLKPANVLMDRDGRPRVTDFGLAKRAATDTQLTATGQVVGTPQYMAPEQARDSKDAGMPADVYSLGAILYYLLLGRPPFQGESFTDLLIKVVSEAPVPPSESRPDVPADLEALCLRCLAKAPADRYPDADKLAEALAPIAAQYPHSSAARSSPVLRAVPSRSSINGLTPTEPDVSVRSASGPALANSLSAGSLPSVAAAATGTNWVLFSALAVVAVALAGTAVYIATRDGKTEVAKQEPEPKPGEQTPAPGGTPAPNQPGPAIVPDPKRPDPGPGVVQPNPPVQPPDKFAWPAAGRADFGLKVDLLAPAAKKDVDGKILLTAGTNIEVHLTAEKDCRVSVWLLDAGGHVVRLFPNEYEPDDRLIAGQKRVVPGKDGGILELTPTEGAGVERLRVFATTGDAPTFPPGVKKEQYTVYATDAERERLASTVRGVVLKKPAAPGAPGAVSEAEVRFRVQK